jgi:hypothetical protein
VKIRYADFNTHTKQLRIGYTACDHIILPAVHDLFRALYDRRQRIRLIGVRFSHLVGGGHQMDAFTDTQEAMDLYQAMDKDPQALRRPHRDARQRYGCEEHRKNGQPLRWAGAGVVGEPENLGKTQVTSKFQVTRLDTSRSGMPTNLITSHL